MSFTLLEHHFYERSQEIAMGHHFIRILLLLIISLMRDTIKKSDAWNEHTFFVPIQPMLPYFAPVRYNRLQYRAARNKQWKYCRENVLMGRVWIHS